MHKPGIMRTIVKIDNVYYDSSIGIHNLPNLGKIANKGGPMLFFPFCCRSGPPIENELPSRNLQFH
jgi:hypothetical protein